MHCPHCGKAGSCVIESRRCRNGSRRRRHRCPHCLRRWSTWDGILSQANGGDTPGRFNLAEVYPKGALSEAQVVSALTRTDLGNRAMGRALGRSGDAIRNLRTGISYRHVRPDIPRWGSADQRLGSDVPSCLNCLHWSSSDRLCGIGLPDPGLEGPSFALYCESRKLL